MKNRPIFDISASREGVRVFREIGTEQFYSVPVNAESFPMQDEPEGGACFQHKMSLKGQGMLGMDDQRARSREVKSGTDREVPFGHGGSTIRGQQTGGDLRLGRAIVVPAGVLAAGTGGPRSSAPLHRKDDGAEPGAAHATGRPLRGHGPGGGRDWPSPSLSHPLYPNRHRVAGTSR